MFHYINNKSFQIICLDMLRCKLFQDASLLRFLVDMRGVDVDDRQVSVDFFSCGRMGMSGGLTFHTLTYALGNFQPDHE